MAKSMNSDSIKQLITADILQTAYEGRKFPSITIAGHEYKDVSVKIETYVIGGRICIELRHEVTEDWDGETIGYSEPLCSATVNVPEIELDPDEVLIKDWSENHGLAQELERLGIIKMADEPDRYVQMLRSFAKAIRAKVLLPKT